MPFIYRTRPSAVLIYGDKEYRDGDRIPISKRDALILAARSRLHRFEEIDGEGVINRESPPPPDGVAAAKK